MNIAKIFKAYFLCIATNNTPDKPMSELKEAMTESVMSTTKLMMATGIYYTRKIYITRIPSMQYLMQACSPTFRCSATHLSYVAPPV